MNKFIRTIAAVGIAFAATLVATPADAATFTWSSRPLTNLDPAGAVVTGGITNFPTKAGLYISQCTKATSVDTLPENCVDLQWVTANGGGGSISAKGPIELTLKSKYSIATKSIDCTVEKCVVYLRYDRTALTDRSEDTILDISFAAATTEVPLKRTDSISVTFNGKVLINNVPNNLGYRAKTVITAVSSSGLPVTLASATDDCSYVNGALTALKGSGSCRLTATTAGDATFEPARAGFPFILVPGNQKISISTLGIKRDSTRVLPATTNFGNSITYKSNSKLCKVEVNLIMVGKGKGCILTATAAGKDQMWLPLKRTIKVNIK
jgi:hypothetical protein